MGSVHDGGSVASDAVLHLEYGDVDIYIYTSVKAFIKMFEECRDESA